jgi:hypothetical protein
MTSLTLPKDVSEAHVDRTTEVHEATWRGIRLRIAYQPNAYGSPETFYHFSCIEVETQPRRQPLPTTDTGYKREHPPGGVVETEGGPLAYVLRRLEHAARKPQWKLIEASSRQGSLF